MTEPYKVLCYPPFKTDAHRLWRWRKGDDFYEQEVESGAKRSYPVSAFYVSKQCCKQSVKLDCVCSLAQSCQEHGITHRGTHD